jgi:hypothetical protein
MNDKFIHNEPNELELVPQQRQSEFPERIHDRKAPAGKFRLLGVDTFEGPGADFLVGDFNDKDEAITEAVKRTRDMVPYYVYDDTGKLLFPRAKRKQLSKSAKIRIWKKGGWLCYWCRRPLIFGQAMKLLALDTGAPAYFHAHWTRDTAPLLDELGAVLDHKECFVDHPDLDVEGNLVAACCKCNARKSSTPLGQFEKRPRRKPIKGKYGEPQHWDGLTSLFLTLAKRHQDALTAEDRSWVNAIEEEMN